MAELYRYAAFISYSSKDAAFAERLHGALERYGIPSSLGQFDLIGGGKKNRIYPVFRDREELSAGNLGDRIEAALKSSANLIVICSPNAAASPWVEKEIQFFAGLGRRDKIFAIISDDAPLLDSSGADATASSFPPAFRTDALADAQALEPLAADARAGKDGFRNAWLKIVAGMIGVTPGQIIDRDRKRRRERAVQLAAAAAVFVCGVSYAAALVDARNWRASLTAYADKQIAQGRSLAGLPYAIAGITPRGGVISAQSERADAILQRVGLAPLLADLGGQQVLIMSYNDDGSALITHDGEDRLAAYLPRQSAGRMELGVLKRSMGPAQLSKANAIFYTQDENGFWSYYDLRNGGRRVQLGKPREVDVSDDENFIITLGDDNKVSYYDVRAGGVRYEMPDLGAIRSISISSDGAVLNTYDGAVSAYYALGPQRRLTPLGDLYSHKLSGDKRVLVTREKSGRAMLRDLRGQDVAKDLGAVWDYSLAKNGAALATKGENNAGLLYDLRTGAAPIDLGIIYQAEFSSDDRYLLTQGENNHYVVRRVGADGPVIDLGELYKCTFSADGAFVVAETSDQVVSVYALSSGQRVLNFEDVFEYKLSKAGAVLMVRPHHDGPTTYHDLRPGGRAANLGVTSDFEMSDDGAIVVVQGMINKSRDFVYDFKAGGRKIDLGDMREFTLTDNGAALMTRQRDGSDVFYDLRDWGRRHVLSKARTYRMSDNGAALIAADYKTDNWIYYNFAAGGQTMELGKGDVREFSDDGAILIMEDETDNQAIYDLRRRPNRMDQRGADLTSAACKASGDAVRPFEFAVRGADPKKLEDKESRDIFGALRGRPWNPCDWRGLFAVAPNATTGDGWFEGARQWIRLIGVRYFGGSDYACAEGTFGAMTAKAGDRRAAARRADRVRMCELYAPDKD